MDMEKVLIDLADFCMCNGGLWEEMAELAQADNAFVEAIQKYKKQIGFDAYFDLDSAYNSVLVWSRKEGFLNGFHHGFMGAFRLLVGLMNEAEI